jgi:ABC-type Fe3+ transport system permease subunit
MGTNTTVLLVVTAMAALVLAGVLAGVVYKTRAPKRVETSKRSRRPA